MKWNLGDERSKDIKDNTNVAYEGDFLTEWLAQSSQCSDCHQDHGHHIAGGRKSGDKSKHGRGSKGEKREREEKREGKKRCGGGVGGVVCVQSRYFGLLPLLQLYRQLSDLAVTDASRNESSSFDCM